MQNVKLLTSQMRYPASFLWQAFQNNKPVVIHMHIIKNVIHAPVILNSLLFIFKVLLGIIESLI